MKRTNPTMLAVLSSLMLGTGRPAVVLTRDARPARTPRREREGQPTAEDLEALDLANARRARKQAARLARNQNIVPQHPRADDQATLSDPPPT